MGACVAVVGRKVAQAGSRVGPGRVRGFGLHRGAVLVFLGGGCGRADQVLGGPE